MDELEKDVLRKMLHHKFIGEKHTSIDNLPKGFPKHIRGDIKKAAENLIRKGFIMAKPTSYGLEVSVDPKQLEEIRQAVFG
ncbi:MAG: hypothetical protein V1866_03310 [archaeon]